MKRPRRNERGEWEWYDSLAFILILSAINLGLYNICTQLKRIAEQMP